MHVIVIFDEFVEKIVFPLKFNLMRKGFGYCFFNTCKEKFSLFRCVKIAVQVYGIV